MQIWFGPVGIAHGACGLEWGGCASSRSTAYLTEGSPCRVGQSASAAVGQSAHAAGGRAPMPPGGGGGGRVGERSQGLRFMSRWLTRIRLGNFSPKSWLPQKWAPRAPGLQTLYTYALF